MQSPDKQKRTLKLSDGELETEYTIVDATTLNMLLNKDGRLGASVLRPGSVITFKMRGQDGLPQTSPPQVSLWMNNTWQCYIGGYEGQTIEVEE